MDSGPAGRSREAGLNSAARRRLALPITSQETSLGRANPPPRMSRRTCLAVRRSASFGCARCGLCAMLELTTWELVQNYVSRRCWSVKIGTKTAAQIHLGRRSEKYLVAGIFSLMATRYCI
jgi:hypothetical protein